MFEFVLSVFSTRGMFVWVLGFCHRADFLYSERANVTERAPVTAKACVKLMVFILNPTGINILGLHLIIDES